MGWRQVDGGGVHTCRTDGRLCCWANDDYGQMGHDGTTTSQPAPVEVVL